MANLPISLLPVDPATASGILIEAAILLVIGAMCVVVPGVLLKLQVRMLEWQRRVFGKLSVDWHLRLVRHPAAPWIVRLLGIFFVAAGLYLLASVAAASPPQPAG